MIFEILFTGFKDAKPSITSLLKKSFNVGSLEPEQVLVPTQSTSGVESLETEQVAVPTQSTSSAGSLETEPEQDTTDVKSAVSSL